MDLADQPSFVDFLAAPRAESVPEWLTLLLTFRATRLEQLGDVCDLSLKNAKFCWDRDITVQRLLEIGETEVALGLICLHQVKHSIDCLITSFMF